MGVHIDAEARDWSKVSLHVRLRWKSTTLRVSPCTEEDLDGVALAQALLSGGFARILREAGSETHVRVSAWASRLTDAQMRFQALIGPLMLYGSPRPYACKEWKWVSVHDRSQKVEFRCKDGVL